MAQGPLVAVAARHEARMAEALRRVWERRQKRLSLVRLAAFLGRGDQQGALAYVEAAMAEEELTAVRDLYIELARRGATTGAKGL